MGMSMAKFQNLRRLGMPSAFLPSRQPSQDDKAQSAPKLWKLLPSPLEDLQLEFLDRFSKTPPRLYHIHDIGDNDGNFGASEPLVFGYPEAEVPSDEAMELSTWLYEIIEHRKDRLPLLRHIVLWFWKARDERELRLRIGGNIYDGPGPDTADEYVATWVQRFGFPAAFQNAGAHFTWSTDYNPPLFNPM
jgi:hypothetical protein